MKRKVNLSTYSVIFSFVVLLFLLWLLYYSQSAGLTITIGVIIISWLFLVGLYMPLSVSAENDGIVVKRAFKKKMIPYNQIKALSPNHG